jgi:hypothetical protein
MSVSLDQKLTVLLKCPIILWHRASNFVTSTTSLLLIGGQLTRQNTSLYFAGNVRFTVHCVVAQQLANTILEAASCATMLKISEPLMTCEMLIPNFVCRIETS